MTTPTHDLLITKVVKEVESRLSALGRSPNRSIIDAAVNIESQGISRIILSNDAAVSKYPKHSDAEFRHANYPGVVIEVSYSQKRKDQPYLAENYITRSQGSVRGAVGSDIEYHRSKKATVPARRPKLYNDGGQPVFEVEQTVYSEVRFFLPNF